MTYFLILASTYEIVSLALADEIRILETASISKHDASKEIIPHLDTLFKRHALTLSDIHCCIVNQGPGPFTTLRTVIATANGLSFATGLPLIGINELESFLDEYTDNAYPQTVVLLNAFNKEVYYSLHAQDKTVLSGCMNIDTFLKTVQEQYPTISPCILSPSKDRTNDTVRFIGNGAELYRNKIIGQFSDRAYIPHPLPQSSSIEQLRKLGVAQWNMQTAVSKQLQPIYLKSIKVISC